MLQGKHVLITGGAGFVGSHLADKIVDYSEHLTILDDMSNGSMGNLKSLLEEKPNKITLIRKDVRNYEDCLSAAHGVDIVFHLAAQINPAKAVDDPVHDFQVNALGTLNILEAARRNKVTKLVQASTNVYGNPKYLPIDENHPMDLLSPYAASKVAGEAYAMVYQSAYGIKTVRLRFSNIYGPRQTTRSESGAVALFIERLLNGQSLVIFGDGKQTRDFVYVTDIVDALITASVTAEADGEVFNIGFGVETTIDELSRMIIQIVSDTTGRELGVHVSYGPQRSADFRRAQMNISKATEKLGYHPKVGLEEGLRQTVRWHLIRSRM
jgi:UDP-glucose 4-epimerase